MANVFVRSTGSTFELVEGGDVSETFDTLRAALDAALEKVATRAKQAFLRDPETGEENGAFRWLPATEEEPSAIGGVRIDATAIEEMAASLNGRTTPVPVDGGSHDSQVHGTAHTGGATLANGWAHWAVVVEGTDGAHELYLWAELVPDVARAVDAGRMALGSVHFGFERLDGEAPRGCVLISHALTNDPAVTSLAPANSVRTDSAQSARRTKAIAGRTLRSSPARKRGKADMTKQAESVNEGADGNGAVAPVESSRSSDGGEGERAMDLGAKMRELLGLAADASDEDVIAALESKLGSGESEAEGEAAASADAAKEVEKARAVSESLRSQLSTLQSQVKALEPLRLEKEKRDREDAVDAAMAKRGMADKSSRERFVALAAKHGVAVALEAIEASHVPPGGGVMTPSAGEAARSSAAPEGTGKPADAAEAIEAVRPIVEKEQPGLRGPALHSAVYARARKEHPEAFRRQAAN